MSEAVSDISLSAGEQIYFMQSRVKDWTGSIRGTEFFGEIMFCPMDPVPRFEINAPITGKVFWIHPPPPDNIGTCILYLEKTTIVTMPPEGKSICDVSPPPPAPRQIGYLMKNVSFHQVESRCMLGAIQNVTFS